MQIIPAEFEPDPDALLGALGFEPGSDGADDFLAMLREGSKHARPRAAIGAERVEAADPATGRVVIGGIEFQSKLLAKNVAGLEAVWPFFLTCGREAYDWAQSITDPFERFLADEILQSALDAATVAFNRHFEEHIHGGKTGIMNPGSLPDWPIEQQRPLFDLFGAAPGEVGLCLTDAMLMLPNKSGSGIRFASENGFVNCRLCPRATCPNRRAEHDQTMAALAM
ncbi:MAG: vitamin B12 dependent methionine synthase [Planctomycetota bacterium]|jgi:hypothetical protein|nr:vitamin B12 dependent methionine synthase [Planctomycetota bacterium]